jgi:hypothetical protein
MSPQSLSYSVYGLVVDTVVVGDSGQRSKVFAYFSNLFVSQLRVWQAQANCTATSFVHIFMVVGLSAWKNVSVFAASCIVATVAKDNSRRARSIDQLPCRYMNKFRGLSRRTVLPVPVAKTANPIKASGSFIADCVFRQFFGERESFHHPIIHGFVGWHS